MPAGKAASQAVHAARLSLLGAVRARPELADAFLSDRCCGTAVVLRGRGAGDLELFVARARALGVPAALFVDRGHVLPPHFDGSPVLTSAAAGPAPRSLLRPLARRFSLWAGEEAA